MLTASLIEQKREQRPWSADDIPMPMQHVSLLGLPGGVAAKYEVRSTTEPQVGRSQILLNTPPKAIEPQRPKSETPLGRDWERIKPTESVRHPPRIPLVAPSGCILGRLGLESGPTVELANAKQLLEHEQVTAARTLLERVIWKYPQDERLRNLYRAIAQGSVVRRDIHYPDRTAEAVWIQEHRALYRGKWVALLGEQVLAIGDDLQSVLRCTSDLHLDEPPLIHHFID